MWRDPPKYPEVTDLETPFLERRPPLLDPLDGEEDDPEDQYEDDMDEDGNVKELDFD